MDLFWIIRLSFIGMLLIYDLIYIYFLKNRKKYENFLENFGINLVLVILYNIFCYIPVIIPSSSEFIPSSTFKQNLFILIWFYLLGSILIILAILIFTLSLKIRKVLGAQDTSGKLLTSGVYGFCRHPIYFAISMTSLGLALILNNMDGLIITPIIILLNFFTGKIEEKYDMRVRFGKTYSEYKKNTRALGPWWYWLIIVLSVIISLIYLML